MNRKLEGKVALVSGSGRGIGREIALKLASEGARVVINDLDAEPATQTVSDIVAAGGTATACVGSVTDSGFADRFVATAVETYGGLDIIVNNAGYTGTTWCKDDDESGRPCSPSTSRHRFASCARRQAHPRCGEAGNRGRPTSCSEGRENLVHSASTGTRARQLRGAKDGINGLTRSMAKEWGRYK